MATTTTKDPYQIGLTKRPWAEIPLPKASRCELKAYVRLQVDQVPYDTPPENIAGLIFEKSDVLVLKVEVIIKHNSSPPTRRGFHVYCKNAADADRVVLMMNNKLFCTRTCVYFRRHWSVEDLEAVRNAALLELGVGSVPKNLVKVVYAMSTYKLGRTNPPSDAVPTAVGEVVDVAADVNAVFIPFSFFDDLAAKVLHSDHPSDAECAHASDALRRLTNAMLPHVGNVNMSHLVDLLSAAKDRSMSPPCTKEDYMTLHHALTHPESTMLPALIRYAMDNIDGNVALRPIADALKLEKEPGALLYLVSFWQWLHARDYAIPERA